MNQYYLHSLQYYNHKVPNGYDLTDQEFGYILL